MQDDDAINEDNIGVTDTGTLSEGTAIDLDPPKREINRGGRPKGYPKSGGRTAPIRKAAQNWDEILGYAVSVMHGEPQWVSGPTGKKYQRIPSAPERQQWTIWLANQAGDQHQESPNPDVVPNEAELRRALEDLVKANAPQVIAPQPDPVDPSSEVISLSHDPAAIAEHDRGVRNAGSKKARPRFDENNPNLGDRLNLPCDFYAIYEEDFFGSKKRRWVLYNSAHDRVQF